MLREPGQPGDLVTGVPQLGAVLVAESIREPIGEDERFVWSFAGPRRLKGFRSDIKLYWARRGNKD